MSGLTRDGTAEPMSRDRIFRRERGQGIFFSPLQPMATSRIGKPYAVDVYFAISNDYTKTHTIHTL